MKKLKKGVLIPFKRTTQWLALIENVIMGCVHYWVFGFPIVTVGFFQALAFSTEYALSAVYQKIIMGHDKEIICYANGKHINRFFSYLMRYVGFLLAYWGVFLSSYLFRLWIISQPEVARWIKDLTLTCFGEAAQAELLTRNMFTAITAACISSFIFCLVVPLTILGKRPFLRFVLRTKIKKKMAMKKSNKH